MPSSFCGRVTPIKRKRAMVANPNCSSCNHLQFDPDFEALHARPYGRTWITRIKGEPDDYSITIPTDFLLRDGRKPKSNQKLKDCKYCQFLHDALSLFFLESSMDWLKHARADSNTFLVIHIRTGFPLVLRCQNVVESNRDWLHLRADIEVFCHDRSALSVCDFPSMYLELPEQEETLEDGECIRFINRNLRNCSGAPDRMANCVVTPNRLLEINWAAQEIKLVQLPPGAPARPNIPEKLAYATLSHCWSETDPDFPRLVRTNVRDWFGGICLDHLPQAIKDAAQVAYANKVHYLWIESLCILQDHEGDRLQQKPCVGAYFRDSVITIVAASSTSPNDSFLYPRREDWITKQIEFTAPSGGTATINLRRRYSRQTSPLDAVDESSRISNLRSFLRTGPLYRHQRCYQEALLGTRVISFTSAAITAICRRHIQCTGNFTVRPNFSRAKVFQDMLYTGQGQQDTALWLEAVMQYTARDMTVHPKEKLTGIAGLASMTSMAQNIRYFVGFWLSNLHEALLWEVRLRPGQRIAARITFPFKAQKAPTLSWASVDAGVYYTEPWNRDFVPDAKIIHACSTRRPYDPFGDVNGGSLKLEGRLIKCEVSQIVSWACRAKGRLSVAHFDMEEEEHGIITSKTKRVPFVADGSLVMVKKGKVVRGHSRKGKACSYNCACRRTNRRTSGRNATFLMRNHREFRKKSLKYGPKKIVGAAYVLCIGWRGIHNWDSGRVEHRSFEGLVLTPSLRFPGTFERIGCIRDVPAAIHGGRERKIITLV